MDTHRPLVVIDGVIHELPDGDQLEGSSSITPIEPVTVFNAGDPQIVFVSTGDVVTTEVR